MLTNEKRLDYQWSTRFRWILYWLLELLLRLKFLREKVWEQLWILFCPKIKIFSHWNGTQFYDICAVSCCAAHLIPVSLRINVDMARILFNRWIEGDLEIENSSVCSVNICEELGRIGYLLTDKTGTLTKNNMVMRKIHMGTISFETDSSASKIHKNLMLPAEHLLLQDQPHFMTGRRDIHYSLYDVAQALAVCHNAIWENLFFWTFIRTFFLTFFFGLLFGLFSDFFFLNFFFDFFFELFFWTFFLEIFCWLFFWTFFLDFFFGIFYEIFFRLFWLFFWTYFLTFFFTFFWTFFFDFFFWDFFYDFFLDFFFDLFSRTFFDFFFVFFF